MNKWYGTGRLTRDPVRRETTSGIAVCNFSIAVMRPGTKREDHISDFFDCVAWRGGADLIYNHFHKGDGIVLSGHLQGREWTDKDGNKRTGTEIQVDDIEFPMSRKQTADQPVQKPAETPVQVDSDEPLPF